MVNESVAAVGKQVRHDDGRRAPPMDKVAPVLVCGALLMWNAVGGLYAGVGRDVPETIVTLGTLCVSMSVIVWFWIYSRQHHIGWVLDMGWFLLVAWPVVVPYYLLKCEGTRGIRRIGLFCLAYFVTLVLGVGLAIALRGMTNG
jgi:hypothetical protein